MVPFCLFVVIALNCARLLRALSDTTSNVLFMAQGLRQTEWWIESFCFLLTIRLQRNKSIWNREVRGMGKITKIDFLYSALMLWCVILSGAFLGWNQSLPFGAENSRGLRMYEILNMCESYWVGLCVCIMVGKQQRGADSYRSSAAFRVVLQIWKSIQIKAAK